MDDPQPVDGNLWGAYVNAGNERWEIVRRSWSVFVRNTRELSQLLAIPSKRTAVSLLLMSDDREATTPFWEELDQRLHNELASAVTLVDHSRRLMKYYRPYIPSMVQEYERRNENVTDLRETAFLRDLRNYLLHYGVPPVIQTLSLSSPAVAGGTGHAIKLSADRLLEWGSWKAKSRDYLAEFKDGPDLRQTVAVYANSMSGLFSWLFEQRLPSHSDPAVLDGFRVEPE